METPRLPSLGHVCVDFHTPDHIYISIEQYKLKGGLHALKRVLCTLNRGQFALKRGLYVLKRVRYALKRGLYALQQDQHTLTRDQYTFTIDQYAFKRCLCTQKRLIYTQKGPAYTQKRSVRPASILKLVRVKMLTKLLRSWASELEVHQPSLCPLKSQGSVFFFRVGACAQTPPSLRVSFYPDSVASAQHVH